MSYGTGGNPEEVARFWAKVRVTEGCWEWAAARIPQGYGQFWHEGRWVYAHRVAYKIRWGAFPPPETPHVLHSCDNPPCVRPSHLRAGTHTDNMRQRRERERRSKQEARVATMTTASNQP